MARGVFGWVMAGLLLLAAAASAQAQPPARDANLSSAIDRAVFAEALRWRAKLRASEAAAVATIENLRAQVQDLKRRSGAGEQARRSLSAEIARLEGEADAKTAALLAEINRRGDEIARLLQAFRRHVTQLANTPEGREALALYNEGRPVESDALIARLDEQELAAIRLSLRLNEAARFRRRGELLLAKIGQGGVTTESVIRLFEEAVARDDGVQSDWLNLANLYPVQRRAAKAEEALRRARALASNPFEAALAGFAGAGVIATGGDRTALLAAGSAAFRQLEEALSLNPAVEAQFSRELAIMRAAGAAFECVDNGRLSPCFDIRLAAAETLMRAYNALPERERRISPLMEPFLTSMRGMYHSENGDGTAIPLFGAAVARTLQLKPDYRNDPESLDLLFTAQSQIAVQHMQAAHPDEALAALREALPYQRRLIALDPTAVQPKLLLAMLTVTGAAVALLRSDKLTALALLDEAGTAVDDAIKITDFTEAHQVRWRILLLRALLDPRGPEAKALLDGLDDAKAKGLIQDADQPLVEALKQANGPSEPAGHGAGRHDPVLSPAGARRSRSGVG